MRGLARAGNRIHEPRPAALKSPFAKIASRSPLSDAFVQAAWVSRLFLLRAPSECLILVRRLPPGGMGEDSALESPAVIGLVKGNLAIRLHSRERMSRGSRMIRRCICEKCPDGSLEMHAPQMVCPLCSLWGNARREVRVWEKMFPGFNRQGFTGQLGSTARD